MLTVMEKGYKIRDSYVYEICEVKDSDLFSQLYKANLCFSVE